MTILTAPSFHRRRTLLIAGFVCLLTTCGFDFVSSSQAFNTLHATVAVLNQTFVVTNANDDGTGSLRAAIVNANTTPGTDTISFNLPGPGAKRISLQTPLPHITEALIIDGSTQPGYNGTPLVEIDGALLNFGDSGLVIKAGGSTVRGLALFGFEAAGIELQSCDNNVIQANYLGVDSTATFVQTNETGIRLSNSANNLIGGTTSAARNLISANRGAGISIDGSNNLVQGNFIGTNPAGTGLLDNSTGVAIVGASSTDNLIGGLSPGTGNLISGNVRGVFITAPGNTVQGNLIGTDISGTKRVRNGTGVESTGENTLIGGLLPGARNIISGNGADGVEISGNGSKVQGNFIGTDITGTLALGNGTGGVRADNNVLIGGTVPEARNVISGNADFRDNLIIGFRGPGVTVQGNYIGPDVTGTRAVNPKSGGISVSGNNNLIGGTVPGAQNVISGNIIGIRIHLFLSGNTIQGNLIGLNAQGTGALPNVIGGIECSFNASDNTIGGTVPGAGNKIAFNGGPGVSLLESIRTSVRGNSIFSNGGLGIDLSPEGVTPNDSNDTDTGTNNLQNFPVLTSVMSSGNSTSIQGSLNSTPNATFQIDFYSSAALDPSGNGEGANFLGSTSITTDSNCNANINTTFPVSLGSRPVVTATATDAKGNTSEFSAGNATGAAGNAQFSVSATQVHEDSGFLNLTVLRKGGSTGNLTVEFATADGTAIAGQDYTSTSGTLTFSNGETSKSFPVQITDDATAEANETFTVLIRNASSLEAVGAVPNLSVIIEDSDSTPLLLLDVDSLLVEESSLGNNAEILFTVRLPAPSLRNVSVDFATENINAIGGASCGSQGTDFETAQGTLVIPPGSTSDSFSIRICGDSIAEVNETFRVRLLNPVNATLDVSGAIVRILDDDVFELLRDQSGPENTQAAALDAVLLLRDPFRVIGIPEWFPSVPDRNTRVMLFIRKLELQPGALPSSVTVTLSSNLAQVHDVPAEDVRPVPNTDLLQVIFRLPDNLPAATYSIHVEALGRSSNTATMRIGP